MRSDVTDKVYGVIVAYHPDLGAFKLCLDSIINQVDKVVVVDNSEDVAWFQALETSDNVRYVSNGANLGVARALNIGLDVASKSGADWLLTMDQDSILCDGYVDRLIAFSAEKGDAYVSLGGLPIEAMSTGQSYSGDVRTLITSGNLVRLSSCLDVGGYEDDLFVDCVDHEFSLRLRKRGYGINLVPDVGFRHVIGDPLKVKFIGFSFFCANHSPIRRYYSTRNRIRLFRDYILVDPVFLLSELKAFFSELVKLTFFEANKLQKFRAIGYGFYDAISGVYGKCGRVV